MTPATLNPSQPDNESWPVLTGIDTVAAKRACGGSFKLYERMLGMLQQQYRNWSQDWFAATCASEAPDHAALCASLHKLRGSVSTIGALHLAEVAEQAESSLRDTREAPCAAVRRVGAVLDELLDQVSAWQRKGRSDGE
jgi:HPt (histidine-containing phosphotransfer) domain-containing protein